MARQTSVTLASNGKYWQARYYDNLGRRRTKSLGAKKLLSKRAANRLCDLLAAELVTNPGRASAEKAPGLGEYLDRYLRQRTDLCDSTRKLHERTCRYLKTFFGETIKIDAITRANASDWRLAMQEGRMSSRETIKEATVCQHVRNVKVIFNHALDEDLLVFNPFDRLKSTAPEPDKDWRYVTIDEFEMLLEACLTDEWRVLLGLCRLAGLRRGEALDLRWEHVDLTSKRIEVFAKKTSKRRIVPIVSRLLELIEAVKPSGEVLEGRIVSLSSNNLHRAFHRVCKRAGFEPWPDCFQVLRRNCETDWAQEFPQHVVSTWIGHNILVSARHYLQVPEELYERASA